MGGPFDNSLDVRSAKNEFSGLNATILKTKVDPVLDAIKGRIIADTGSDNKRHSMIRTDGQPLKLNTANGQIDSTSFVR